MSVNGVVLSQSKKHAQQKISDRGYAMTRLELALIAVSVCTTFMVILSQNRKQNTKALYNNRPKSEWDYHGRKRRKKEW